MKIEVVVHNHGDDAILEYLKNFKEELMATLEQFQTGFAAVEAETTRIGELIIQLTAAINAGSLTEEQEEAALASLTAAGERLKAVGKTVENPVPEPENPPVEIPVPDPSARRRS